MKRILVGFCIVVLSILTLGAAAFAADGGMGNMPMPSVSPHATAAPKATPMQMSTPAATAMQMSSPTADTGAPWRIATLALAVVLIVGLALARRERSPVTISIFVLGGVAIAALAFFQGRASSTGNMSAMGDARGVASVPVTVVQLGMDPPGREISAPANVAPYLTQNIAARVPGVLTDLSAYAGDQLRAGEVVARLSEPELQSNAQAAAAGAQAAQSAIRSAENDAAATSADVIAARERVRYWDAEISRERTLLAQGAVSTQEYQDERAQAAGARSAYAAALSKAASTRFNVQTTKAQASQAAASAQSEAVTAGYTNVLAPDDSVVMKRLVDPGVYVSAGTPILQVAVLNKLRVQAQVPQQDLPGVRIGTPLDVMFDNGRALHGRVSSVSPVVDPATHTAIAEAIVANDEETYQPGGYVRAILHVEGTSARNSFSVPSAAVVGGTQTAIWTNQNGIAHRVPVTVLSDDGVNAQITGELHPGDRVVVTGAADLEEGQAITEAVR